ncbi:metal-sensitive transcriptional regulator [Sinomonas atrocyanea]|jgi:DNA-binding FrmR family transcriptional regulator|uniref:metal-sensitive transcriptional regulator n=1 Tax=Sinomonas atrocyanea TaxID=37927 RepID=UPI0028596AC9|nr:metal-sensitive transcriptional regulator [Sinomonas atrocyanea]MDR6620875.1 DNA-binding FrmR family transcriptional regulator [Sinomonas atrocyanea]
MKGVSVDGPAAQDLPQSVELHRLANRLKRAHGQLRAVIDAVESGANCRAVVTQLAAVRGALDKAGFELISGAMRECASTPGSPDGTGLTMEELRRLFLTLA